MRIDCSNLANQIVTLKNLAERLDDLYLEALNTRDFSECLRLRNEIRPLLAELRIEFPKSLKEGFKKILENRGVDCTKMDKLLEMVDKWEDSVDIARELDPNCPLPDIRLVLKHLRALSREQLEMLGEMGKPVLLITPGNKFENKIKAMNKNLHTFDKSVVPLKAIIQKRSLLDFRGQPNEPGSFRKVWTPVNNRVSIVDGQSEMPMRPGFSEWDRRYHDIMNEFEAKKMKMIDIHEYLVLIQLSLKYSEKTGDKNEVIDQRFSSALEKRYLTETTLIPIGHSRSENSGDEHEAARLYLEDGDPEWSLAHLVGRPSLPLMEY